MSQSYKLSDSSIAQIVQLIQLGILTGTDISDQMRTLRLNLSDDKTSLVPDPEYLESFNDNLSKMKENNREESAGGVFAFDGE